jgi:hypothetical protein
MKNKSESSSSSWLELTAGHVLAAASALLNPRRLD